MKKKKKKIVVYLGTYLSPPAAALVRNCRGAKINLNQKKKKVLSTGEKVNRGPPAKNNRKLPLQQREQGLSTFRPKPGLDQRPSSSSSSEPFTTLPFCHDQIFVTLSTIPFLGAPLESAGTTKPFSISTTNSRLPERSLAPLPPSAQVQPERESHPFLSFPHLPHAGYHLT